MQTNLSQMKFQVLYGPKYGRVCGASRIYSRPQRPLIISQRQPSIANQHLANRSTVIVRAQFQNYNQRALKGFLLGKEEATRSGAVMMRQEHLILGMIIEQVPKNTFYRHGISVQAAREAVAHVLRYQQVTQNPVDPYTRLLIGRDVKDTLKYAHKLARIRECPYVAPEHIVLAAIDGVHPGGRKVITKLGVNLQALKRRVIGTLKAELKEQYQYPMGGTISPISDYVSYQIQKPVVQPVQPVSGQSMLSKYCTDLVPQAKLGLIDPVIGRDKEIFRTVQILSRRTKSNAVLLGPPGVGKTAVAEGLALSIARNLLPDGDPLPATLARKRIMLVDVPRLFAGSKERGELEQRVRTFVEEVSIQRDIILVIDEVHVLAGGGGAGNGKSGGSGGSELGGLLKPALVSGKVQCVGTSTHKEYATYMERDAALVRRFLPVEVEELMGQDVHNVVGGVVQRYATWHNVVYREDALKRAVDLAHQHLRNRQMPDKVIDIIDEAGSRVRMAVHEARQARDTPPPSPRQPSVAARLTAHHQVLDAKEQAVGDGLFEEAQLLRVRELEGIAELSGPACDAPVLAWVEVSDVEATVASMTGVPVAKLTSNNVARLEQLPALLSRHVVGQEAAIDAVCSAVKRGACGIRCSGRPIASIMMTGPPGVGKSQLGKALAEEYFGKDNFTCLDMGEYMEPHSVSKLIGAPPGYIGYGEEGVLAAAVRRCPHGVIMFDDVDKAHPAVLRVLLQVLEDGRLTDQQGRVTRFDHTVILLTTNIAQEDNTSTYSQDHGTASDAAETDPASASGTESDGNGSVLEHSKCMDSLSLYFGPELMNRIDRVVQFQQLTSQHLSKIVDIYCNSVAKRVHALGMELHMHSDVVQHVITYARKFMGAVDTDMAPFLEEREGVQGVTSAKRKMMQDSMMGSGGEGRYLRQAVTSCVEDPLTDAIINGVIKEGDTAYMYVDDHDRVKVSSLTDEVAVGPSEPADGNSKSTVRKLKQPANVVHVLP